MMQKKVLYVFDNINYVNGVQRVTAAQIHSLLNEFDITLFSMMPANMKTKELFKNCKFLDTKADKYMQLFGCSLREVCLSKQYNFIDKCIRLWFSVLTKVQLQEKFLSLILKKKVTSEFERFDIICVISEASRMREIVAKLSKPKKIQWIHTDYALWSQYSDWTRRITKNDKKLYDKYDAIVCLSNISKAGLERIHPELREKVFVIPNMQPVQQIREKAMESVDIVFDKARKPIFITVGRMEKEKAFDRILLLCKRLRDIDLDFSWYFIGSGSLLDDLVCQHKKLGLEEIVHFIGELDNPYPLMKEADAFVLLSHYEGLPVTIDEAKILNVPVIATRVGGIPEQIEEGKEGILVDADEEAIYNVLKDVIVNPEILEEIQNNQKRYIFPDKEIRKKVVQLFLNI